MNTKAKIIAAFAIATVSGTVLGLLLSSGKGAQRMLTDRTKSERESFLHKLLRSNNKSESKDLAQHAEEYEQE